MTDYGTGISRIILKGQINRTFCFYVFDLSGIPTVKVMIMSRYHYRPVTVLGPTLPTVTVFGPTLPTVTDRYRILPLLALQALPILKGPFEQIFKVL